MRDYKDMVESVLAAVKNIEDEELKRSIALRLLEDALVRVSPEHVVRSPEGSTEAIAASADWAQQLADQAEVSREKVLSVLTRDEDGNLTLITNELGTASMERLKNMMVLVLWAQRTISKKDLYVAQSDVTKKIKDLGVDTNNLTNAAKADPNIQQVTIGRKRMLQLKGDWKKRAAEILAQYPT